MTLPGERRTERNLRRRLEQALARCARTRVVHRYSEKGVVKREVRVHVLETRRVKRLRKRLVRYDQRRALAKAGKYP